MFLVNVTQKTITKREYIQSCVFAGMTCFLFALQKIFEISYFAYIALGLAVFYCIFGNIFGSLFFMFFICSNTYYMILDTTAICGYLAIIICIRMIRFINDKKLGLFNFFCIILLLFSSINGFFLSDDIPFIVGMIKVVALLIMFTQVINFSQQKEECVLKCAKSYVYGVIFGGLLGLLYYFYFGMSLLPSGENNYRFIGLTNDPNYLSSTMILSFAIILMDCLETGDFKISNILILSFTCIVGLLTLSRGFIVSLSIVLLFGLPCFFSSKRISGNYKTTFLVVLLLLIAIAGVALGEVFEKIQERWTAKETQGGSGRIEIWIIYFKRITSSFKSFMIGNGMASIQDDIGREIAAHNIVLQVFYMFGFLGFMLVLAVFYFLWKLLVVKKNQRKTYKILPFIATLISYMFLSGFTGENFILAISLSIAINSIL